jgi:hypothetical protein
MTKSICVVDGCERPRVARQMCRLHYDRLRRHGDPMYTNPLRSPYGTGGETLKALVLIETDDCTPWPYGKHSTGYGQVTIDGSKTCAHHWACEFAHGPRPSRADAAHSCGNRGCVNPRHLRWATRSENEADKVLHGRDNRGENHHGHKLSVAQVIAIREAAAAGARPVDLGAEYGVDPSTIREVVKRETWKSVA